MYMTENVILYTRKRMRMLMQHYMLLISITGRMSFKIWVFIHKDGFLAVKMDVLEQKAFNN